MRNIRYTKDLQESSRSWHGAGFACLGLASLALMFGLGYRVGKREVELKENTSRIHDIKKQQLESEPLTFYTSLTKDGRKKTPAPIAAVLRPGPTIASPTLLDSPPSDLQQALSRLQTTTAILQPKNDELLAVDNNAEVTDYTIQVSAFPSQAEAKIYAGYLQQKGYIPDIVEIQIPNKGIWHRVRIGHYKNIKEAERAKMQLAQTDITGWVVKRQ